MNFYPVNFFYRQKAVHKSPPCMSTGGLKKAVFFIQLLHAVGIVRSILPQSVFFRRFPVFLGVIIFLKCWPPCRFTWGVTPWAFQAHFGSKSVRYLADTYSMEIRVNTWIDCNCLPIERSSQNNNKTILWNWYHNRPISTKHLVILSCQSPYYARWEMTKLPDFLT